MPLTAKQERFVEEYLVDLNATHAARRAGYGKKGAHTAGFRLLRHVEVQAQITKKRKQLTRRTEVSAERVINELALLAFSNMQDYMRVTSDGSPYVDLSDMTREQAAALSEVTIDEYKDGRGEDGREVRRVKAKLSDKRAALVDLGKHLGLFDGRGAEEEAAQPVSVHFHVNAPKGDVRVTEPEHASTHLPDEATD